MMTSHDVDLFGHDGYPAYSTSELRRRHRLLEELAAERDLSSVVVFDSRDQFYGHIQYFTNWPTSTDAYLVHRRDHDPVLLLRPYNHLPTATACSSASDVVYGGASIEEMLDKLKRLVSGSATDGRGRRVGFIGNAPHAATSWLSKEVGALEWVDCNAAYRRWRSVLSDEEFAFVSVACTMGDAALAALGDGVRPGMREYELAKTIGDAFLGRRGTALMHYYLTTPMAKPDGCVPRQQPTDRVIQAGDVLTTELSCWYWGYAGQALRTYAICADPTPLYANLYDVASAVYADIVDGLRPGVTAGELLARTDVIEEEGFTIWDSVIHGFGGPALLPPVVRTRATGGVAAPADPADAYVVQENSLVIVQPNIITPDERAGVQLGNAVRVAASGPEVLHSYPMAFGRCGA